jgi:hypothetical protein
MSFSHMSWGDWAVGAVVLVVLHVAVMAANFLLWCLSVLILR